METQTQTPSKTAVPVAGVQKGQSLVTKFANKYNIEPGRLLSTLKATAFRQSEREATNEEMAALLVVADQYNLNPFTRELFAFFDKHKGIVPVVSVDGWARIINDNDQLDGVEFEYKYSSDVEDADHLVSCTAIIYRKDRKNPTKITEFFSECKRNTGPWGSHPRRMLRHKALIQCSRVAFGFSGIYDEDEAARIIEIGGGAPIIDESGGAKAVEGEVETATRTSSLASSLATQARAASDAEVIDSSTGEIKAATVESVREAIAKATDKEHLPELATIMKLADDDLRKELMREWQAKLTLLTKGPDAPAEPAKSEAPAEKAAPAKKAEAKKAEAKAPAPAEPPATPLDKTPPPAPMSPPTSEDGTDAIRDKVLQEFKATKNVDELDAIADRENSRKWSKAHRGEIYRAYMARREEFDGG